MDTASAVKTAPVPVLAPEPAPAPSPPPSPEAPVSPPSPSLSPSPSPPRHATLRLASLDAYRGFIMLLMVSGGFGIPKVAQNLPESLWPKIAPWFEHAAWAG